VSKAAIRDWLVGIAEITDYVSNRIFSGHIPQGVTETCIVLTKVDANHEYSLANEISPTQFIYQLDIYDSGAAGRANVDAVAELIRLRLSGYRGQLNDDVYCHVATISRDNDLDIPPGDSSDQWTARTSFDISLFLNTTEPTH
jgi:hypothetical protein